MGTTANSTTQYVIKAYQSGIPIPDSMTLQTIGFDVRINAEVLTLSINDTTNDPPDSDLIQQIGLFARVGGGKNRFGITTRAVKIKRLVGTSPLQFYITRTVPWLKDNLEDTVNSTSPPSISYQGQTDWIFVSQRVESVGDG
jgi:hypothetical protein